MPKKIIKKDKNIRAVRKFTDREQPRKVFFDKYEKLKSELQNCEDIYIITYYGVGGIGKTTLLKKLQTELDEKIKNPYYVYYDFETNADMKTTLQMIKTKLENKYKFSFPLFDIAFYAYSNKIGENISKKEIQSIIEKSRTLSFITDAAEEIPVIGLASKLIKLADSGIAILRNATSKYKKQLEEIENASAEEIYKELPYYFSLDLKENIKNINEPLVIFLDTYERLVNEVKDSGYAVANDLWLRDENGPILNVPGILWVIAGREKIKWEEMDADWADTLDQHILGDLAFNDADIFLKEAGFTDDTFRKEIYELTHGTPLYLDMCVDTYEILKSEGKEITINDFGKNTDILTERYIRYMDHQSSEISYMLSNIPVWTDEMIHEIGPKILPDYSYVLYEKIKDLSFICKSDNHYYVHKTVGDTFKRTCPKIIKEKCIKNLYEYYLNFLLNNSSINIEYLSVVKNYLEISQDYINDENANKVFEDAKEIENILSSACLFYQNYAFCTILYNRWYKKYQNKENVYLLKLMYAESLSYYQKKEKSLEIYEELWEEYKDKNISFLNEIINMLGLLYQLLYPNNQIIMEVIQKLESLEEPDYNDIYNLGYYYHLAHDDKTSMIYFQSLLENKDIDEENKIYILALMFASVPAIILNTSDTFNDMVCILEKELDKFTNPDIDTIGLKMGMANYYSLGGNNMEKALKYINEAEEAYNCYFDEVNQLFASIAIIKINILDNLDQEKLKDYAKSLYNKIDADFETPDIIVLLIRVLHILHKDKELDSIYQKCLKIYNADVLITIGLYAGINEDNDIVRKIIEKILKIEKKDAGIYEQTVFLLMPICYEEDELNKNIDEFYETYKSAINGDKDLLKLLIRRIIELYENFYNNSPRKNYYLQKLQELCNEK